MPGFFYDHESASKQNKNDKHPGKSFCKTAPVQNNAYAVLNHLSIWVIIA
jgi:hypothetical protein